MDKSLDLGGREDSNAGMMEGLKIIFLNESKVSKVQWSEGERWRNSIDRDFSFHRNDSPDWLECNDKNPYHLQGRDESYCDFQCDQWNGLKWVIEWRFGRGMRKCPMVIIDMIGVSTLIWIESQGSEYSIQQVISYQWLGSLDSMCIVMGNDGGVLMLLYSTRIIEWHFSKISLVVRMMRSLGNFLDRMSTLPIIIIKMVALSQSLVTD